MRISEPPIIENMRQYFSSKFLRIAEETDANTLESLAILTNWINKNRGCNFDVKVLFLQLKMMKSNLVNLH